MGTGGEPKLSAMSRHSKMFHKPAKLSMAHNIFQWSTMTKNRKGAALGFYVYGTIAALIFCISSMGMASGWGWFFIAFSIGCLLLVVFVNEQWLKFLSAWSNLFWWI